MSTKITLTVQMKVDVKVKNDKRIYDHQYIKYYEYESLH